jgi:hypothetical protein
MGKPQRLSLGQQHPAGSQAVAEEQLVRTFCRARGLAYTAQPVFYDMAILERINL